MLVDEDISWKYRNEGRSWMMTAAAPICPTTITLRGDCRQCRAARPANADTAHITDLDRPDVFERYDIRIRTRISPIGLNPARAEQTTLDVTQAIIAVRANVFPQ